MLELWFYLTNARSNYLYQVYRYQWVLWITFFILV